MKPFTYILIRSHRKSVSVSLNNKADIIVRAPLRVSVGVIESILDRERLRIDKALSRHRERADATRKEYVDGEQFWYLGRRCPLKIVESAAHPLVFELETFRLLRHSRYRARQLFADWYRAEASLYLLKRARAMATRREVRHGRIRVRDMKSRWGSCGPNGDITFNIKLMMAPIEVVDYVIAHELAHIAEKNHSESFWGEVSRLYPNFSPCRKWLSRNGYALSW